eukprot:TRINITY_DN23120_c0_g1_i1.p1 TRINITY_DN23120_c0_g1~~TRINITY_DN23120_c0_g1_i1.p1  ORF type:complete len:183 (+),score=39.50 TRINITY_DN23120_c0_g1_i1:90-638(+)
MKYGDSLLILAISFGAACFCEALSWLIIYRTPGYKNLRTSIDKTSKKLETMKSMNSSGKKSSKAKKMDRFENSLKDANRDLTFAKFRSGAVVAISLVLVFGLLSSLFEGKPVAKLPFTPFVFIQKMTHRGLPGDDPTDCSMAFLYFLCSMAIRSNLQKILGFAPPRSAGQNPFGIPEPGTAK